MNHRKPNLTHSKCEQCGERRDYTPEWLVFIACFILVVGCIVWAFLST